MLNIPNNIFTPSICHSIEKDINLEIKKQTNIKIDDALDSMEKDIPRLMYCIEGRRAATLRHLLHWSSVDINFRWIKDNIHSLSFIHQGLYQIIMDHLHIKYRSQDILSVGLDGKNSYVMFEFLTQQQRKYIIMTAGGRISAMIGREGFFEANRDNSHINISLALEFFPKRTNFFRDKHPYIKVLPQSELGESQYNMSFMENSS